MISTLNGALMEALRNLAPAPSAKQSVLLNSGSPALTFVAVSGAWKMDVPLYIPPQVVVTLSDGTSFLAMPQLENSIQKAMVFANGSYSALVAEGGLDGGATLNCSGLNVKGVYSTGSYFSLNGITLNECGGMNISTCSSAVHFEGKPFSCCSEVVHCRILGGCRAVWTQAVSRIIVHHNSVLNSRKHTIDFDSFSTNSLVWSNNISGSVQEAIFIEQGSTNVVVVGNNLSGNNVGIGIFNYEFSSLTKDHMIVGNTIGGSRKYGFTSGSTRGGVGNVSWVGVASVTVVGNDLYGDNSVGVHANGPQTGTLFLSNSDLVGFDAAALALTGGASIVLDPLGRALTIPGSFTRSPSPTPLVVSILLSPTTTKSPSLSPSSSTIISTHTPKPIPVSFTSSTSPACEDTLLAPASGLLWGAVGYIVGGATAAFYFIWRGKTNTNTSGHAPFKRKSVLASL